jgi:Dna[CI] antecedent DciA-like protein
VDREADIRSEAGTGSRRTRGRGKSVPGRHGVASLDSALKSFLRASGIGERLGPWAMFQAFSEAAGPAFARHARAVRFARGELCVEVDSAPHLAELKGFRGEEIRARTNQVLGREDIRKIAFRLKR